MEERVLAWIEDHEMIAPGTDVICAVSGGIDSMVLLHLMNNLSIKYGFTVCAAHFNHKIRRDEATRDEMFVRRYCEKNYIAFYSGSGDVISYAVNNSLSTEDAARQLRYSFLSNIVPDGLIATAHHADDNLETMLIKLVRGCGPTGICGIPPVRGNIIRPLLPFTRREIVEYAESHNISYVEDSTNFSNDYLRNRIRHNIIPQLVAENPNIATNFINTSSALREDDIYLRSQAVHYYNLLGISDNIIHLYTHVESKTGHRETVSLGDLPSPIFTRVVKLFLEKNNIHYTANTITTICDAIASAKQTYKFNLPGGKVFMIKGDIIMIVDDVWRGGFNHTDKGIWRLDPSKPFESTIYSFDLGFSELPMIIELEHGTVKIEKAIYTGSLDFDTLYFPISDNILIRNIHSSDHIKLPGGTKKVRKALKDKGLLGENWIQYPVLVDTRTNTIVGVLGLGVNLDYRVNIGDKCARVSLV